MIERSEKDKTERTFDPSRYLTRLPRSARQPDGSWRTVENEYLEVKWRLLWLRTEEPNATIETEMVSHAGDTAVFRARVTLPGGGSATGWGQERAGDFQDYLEKAETKALGRALAALGFGTQFCEDFEFERSPAQRPGSLRVVDAPVDSDRAVRPVTGPQVRAIYAIAHGTLGLSDEELDERCHERYGCLPGALTRRQASELIDALKLTAAEATTAETSG
jgi:hypothetical protein